VLIVRSKAVDPRRTTDMMVEEEKTREHFEEMKDIFQIFYPCRWIEVFQKYVDDFVQDRLLLAKNIMAKPVMKEEDCVRLHGLRRMVAGAVQEGELIRQPKCHVTWAKLESMIVWDGRGCVFITFFHSRLMLCTELI
jgi:hypothetical protein